MIAGTGAVGGLCGLGNDAASIWRAMRDGRSAIGTLSGKLTEGMKIKTGCAIDALPDHGLDRRRTVSMDRFSLFAVIAAREALAELLAAVDGDHREDFRRTLSTAHRYLGAQR